MTPQIQFEPSRKQLHLKRIIRGKEADRKKLFTISRNLEVQEQRQPRPFLKTALGKLPPELRVMIYQHLLVIPQFQVDTYRDETNATGSSTTSKRFIHLRKSSLSILRTCRQLKHEARPILLESGIPYFANARELLGYLTGAGSRGRPRLEAFRIGNLVSPEPFKHRNAHERSGMYYFDKGGDFISCHYGTKDPDVTSAFGLLKECECLRTIYIDMKQGEENMHSTILQTLVNKEHEELYNPGFDDWSLMPGFLPDVYTQGFLYDWFISPTTESRFCSRELWYICSMSMYYMLVSSGQPMGRDALVKVRLNPFSSPQPFGVTHLGNLPQKILIQIYHELVATRSIHMHQWDVTQSIHAGTRSSGGSPVRSRKYVHLQASHPAVLQVCRLMNLQARHLFLGHQSYYTDNAKEFQHLVRLSLRTSLLPLFDCNTVTSLCVKDIVSWSDKKGHYLDNATLISVSQLDKWRVLQNICFCMRVGEELGYLEFLFLLPHMSQGVVDFLDDSHWIIRQQYFGEEWQLQYACFDTNVLMYKRGKNGEQLSDEDIAIQRRTLKARSTALQLDDGDERYVEVQIDAGPEWLMRAGMQSLSDQFSTLSLG